MEWRTTPYRTAQQPHKSNSIKPRFPFLPCLPQPAEASVFAREGRAAVQIVAEHGAAQVRQVHADLVGPPYGFYGVVVVLLDRCSNTPWRAFHFTGQSIPQRSPFPPPPHHFQTTHLLESALLRG